MTKKELEKRVSELEKERDLWRDIASKWFSTIPMPVITPQVQPWPYSMPEPFVEIYCKHDDPTSGILATLTGPLSVS